MATWLTADDTELQVLWPDVPMDDAVANLFLSAAKDACLAYAPELIPTGYAPVTLTWPTGYTLRLTREGDVITGVLTSSGGAASTVIRPLPATFLPAGTVRVLEYNSPDAPTAVLTINDVPALGGIGASYSGQIAAGETITAQWVGDPVPGDGIPDSWVLAQALQARNLYNSAKASPGGDMDGSGYGITAFPLDWQVQQLLRPRRAVGVIA
ncbi:hypothetical protein MRBLWO14_001169 [Microbacterium sp. LWO14-1.2]|uniref:hypothetical protein n=1 Tax=Microbacterium sp. LWO14-1.2 TaxID=3135263 RepID=UPI003138639A